MKIFFRLLVSLALILTTIGSVLGQNHACLWDPTSGLRDLGSLGADSFAYAVNDTGTVVGWYAPTDGRVYLHGFVWTEATGMVDIGVPGGGDSATAQVICTGVNNAGNVVGYARQVDGQQVAFFWSPMDGFTTFSNFSTEADDINAAYAINDQNEVTGRLGYDRRGFIVHAFLWSPDMTEPRDLGTLGDFIDGSGGLAINNRGQIVGVAGFAGTGEPMRWTRKTKMTLLGVLPDAVYAEAQAINDAGAIVGLDQTSTSGRGFYTATGMGLKFLKGLGGNTIVPYGINHDGVIVGYASDATGASYGVRWQDFTSTPEIIPRVNNAKAINSLGQIVGYAYFGP